MPLAAEAPADTGRGHAEFGRRLHFRRAEYIARQPLIDHDIGFTTAA
jgi:hypothetical protein